MTAQVLVPRIGTISSGEPHESLTNTGQVHETFTIPHRGPIRRPRDIVDDTAVVIGFGGPPPPALPDNDHAIVAEYAHLVSRVISRFPHRLLHGVLDRDDLHQEGLLALLTAARTWQPARGPFAGYAHTVISNAVGGAIRKADCMPEKVRRDAKELTAALTSIPVTDTAALAVQTGLSKRRIMHVLAWMAVTAGQADLDDNVVDRTCTSPEETVVQADERERIKGALEALPERERQVLLARLVDGHSVRQTAHQMGLSPTRITQIYAQALGKVRHLVGG